MLRETEIQHGALFFPRPQLAARLTDILFTPGRTIWAILEVLLLIAAFFFCSWGSPYLEWGIFDSKLILLTISFSLIFVLFSVGLGQYERDRRFSITKIVFNTFVASAVSFTFSLSITYFTAYGTFGRLNLIWGTGGAFLSIIAVRLMFAFLFRLIPYRFTVLGSSDLVADIVSFLATPGNRESKYIQYRPCPANHDFDVAAFLDKEKIHDVIVTEDILRTIMDHMLILKILEKRIRLLHEEHFYSEFFERLPIARLDAGKFLNKDLKATSVVYESVKRFLDIAVSFTALVVLAPLFPLIALLIKIDSPGKALFFQPRQGRFRRSFMMYKFRTMYKRQSCQDASGGFTREADVRVTRIGRLLRPLHIDELPQLWNILKGDMSLVGPRPEALSFAQRMGQEISLYDFRYTVRPGLTGHAQILAGYMLDSAEETQRKLAFDLYYITNRSLLMDLRIILRTLFIVIKKIL